jgi:hypothetical protein
MKLLHTVILSACLSTQMASVGLASGSYCACMPKPPRSARNAIDRDRYDLGQKVFNRKAVEGKGDAAPQLERLQALQAKLPARIGKKQVLTERAGKLTSEQLDALEYFVEQRYGRSR